MNLYFYSQVNLSIPIDHNIDCLKITPHVGHLLVLSMKSGAISLLVPVGHVPIPHLALPLTVKPAKPRLCYGVTFLNLWIADQPFTLDHLCDVPRYVCQFLPNYLR